MSSSKIEELKRRRQREKTKKRNQVPYGIILLTLSIIIYVLLLKYNFKNSIFWLIGILIGVVLERSRFCFAAGFRDPVLVGNTSIMKAIIIGLVITTIGFGVIQYNSVDSYENFNITDVPGQIYPVGINTVIGAIIFGIGMVIAGGCVSGTLMRIGEGFALQLVVLIGLIIGTALGANHFEFWERSLMDRTYVVYIPKYVGFPTAIIVQIVILVFLYKFADWYDKKNNTMSMY